MYYALSYWFTSNMLPFGKLSPESDLCTEPELKQNQFLCITSRSIWGSGDLTGPPFCGSYK